jgi:inner membrane protein
MKQNLMLKLLAVAGLTVVIQIALWMVSSTITDRQQYRDEAVKSIEASYAGPQTLIGPVLVRPYTQTTETQEPDAKGKMQTVKHVAELTATTFPHVLEVRGKMTPTERQHGLYKVTVYEFGGHLTGSFEVVDPQTTGTVVWGEPYLALSVDDVRGIVGRRRWWSTARRGRCFRELRRRGVGSRICGFRCAG